MEQGFIPETNESIKKDWLAASIKVALEAMRNMKSDSDALMAVEDAFPKYPNEIRGSS